MIYKSMEIHLYTIFLSFFCYNEKWKMFFFFNHYAKNPFRTLQNSIKPISNYLVRCHPCNLISWTSQPNFHVLGPVGDSFQQKQHNATSFGLIWQSKNRTRKSSEPTIPRASFINLFILFLKGPCSCINVKYPVKQIIQNQPAHGGNCKPSTQRGIDINSHERKLEKSDLLNIDSKLSEDKRNSQRPVLLGDSSKQPRQ